MGESPAACLTQPFCYSSSFSNESNKEESSTSSDSVMNLPNEIDPIKALEESVSFGRFMTESLEWEKWSTFSHNRYVEEIERIIKPGSVAEKKAFFEALAAQKAAGLLEEAKSESFSKQEHDETSLPQNENNENENQIEDVDSDDLQTMEISTDPIISAEDNTATQMNNNPSLRNKRSNAKSDKFSFIRQINKLKRKFETTRVGSKDKWSPQTTPTKASKSELQKNPSFSPLTEEQKRNNMKTEESQRDASSKKERAHKKTGKSRLCFCFKPSSPPNIQH